MLQYFEDELFLVSHGRLHTSFRSVSLSSSSPLSLCDRTPPLFIRGLCSGMQFQLFWHLGFTLATSLLASPVSACEGDCIVGITNALVGNYTPPVATAISDLV